MPPACKPVFRRNASDAVASGVSGSVRRHGTFDIVGDTSENYPDKPGKAGSASWGGIRYDHYPDIHKDADGGAVHCPELVQRILDGGHEITSHTYRHVPLWSETAGLRRQAAFKNLAEVTQDLRRLDELMRRDYGYAIRLAPAALCG